ncbi:MAG: peptidase T [Candidatus Marinimicrobia bacterium]|nr:peptidase T [Candidatus Neomarinimicrobiota bacterium]
MREKMVERFLRYVKIDTQSREGVEDVFPSTEKQKNLLTLLKNELIEMGLKEVEMDQYGYVFGTFPSNLPEEEAAKIPTIGLLAHVDTSPDVTGENVKPVVHKNYAGGDILLPGDPSVIIQEDHHLKYHSGDDIITTDGTTLLGADDKAGITEIMTAIDYLREHPELKHGKIRVGFTPDEEVGNGTKYFDVKKFNADFAYTLDGEQVGEIEDETFNAAMGLFTARGINVHPGYAKDKLVSAIRIIADVVKEMEMDPAPETTEKREGYLHPFAMEGGTEAATLKVLIRDFEKSGMEMRKRRLSEICEKIGGKYPKAELELKIVEQYENMKVVLDKEPRTVANALEAVRRTGLDPIRMSIRGGTDGARLCFMGLPTPNIFTGGHNFHAKTEWIAIQGMEKAVETIVNLVQIWTEK